MSDNGIGIPLVEQDKVFAKFYRGSNLPDKNIPGLRLGLSYVQITYLRRALRIDPTIQIVSVPRKGYMLKG